MYKNNNNIRVEHEQAAVVLGVLQALLGQVEATAAHRGLAKLLPLQLRVNLARNVTGNVQFL